MTEGIPLPVVALALTALLGILAWLRAGNAEHRRAMDAKAARDADALRGEQDRNTKRLAAQRQAEAEASDFYVFADFAHGPVTIRFTKKPGDAPVMDARVVAVDSGTGRSYGPYCCDAAVLRGVATGSALWTACEVLGSGPDNWRRLEGFAYWVSSGHVFRAPLRVYPAADRGRLFDTDLHVRACLGALAEGVALPV